MKKIIEIEIGEIYKLLFNIMNEETTFILENQEVDFYINYFINKLDVLFDLNIIEYEEYILYKKIYTDKDYDLINRLSVLYEYFYCDCEQNKSIQNDYNFLFNLMNNNLELIFNQMPYKMFLDSPYWKIISKYKKEFSGNKCQLCNSEKLLNTHHNNYKNRGKEYKNLNDLIVLCNKCHSKFHNKD